MMAAHARDTWVMRALLPVVDPGGTANRHGARLRRSFKYHHTTVSTLVQGGKGISPPVSPGTRAPANRNARGAGAGRQMGAAAARKRGFAEAARTRVAVFHALWQSVRSSDFFVGCERPHARR